MVLETNEQESKAATPAIKLDNTNDYNATNNSLVAYCNHLEDKDTKCKVNYCIYQLPDIRIEGEYFEILDSGYLTRCCKHVFDNTKICPENCAVYQATTRAIENINKSPEKYNYDYIDEVFFNHKINEMQCILTKGQDSYSYITSKP